MDKEKLFKLCICTSNGKGNRMSTYKFKELREVTAKDRSEIYQYAIKRSKEIVSGQHLEAKTDLKPTKEES